MLVLHGLCTAAGEPVLWAEDSDLPARRPGRASRSATAHPFAVPGERLAGLLPGRPGELKTETLVVLLPSRPAAPEPSPELVRDPLTVGRQPRGTVRLHPWLVPVVLATSELLDRLDELDGGGVDWRLGATVPYLCAVSGLACDLVSRGRVLPDVVVEPYGPVARWRPVLSGVDAARFATLRDAMPPAVRAEQVGPATLDGPEPAELLRATLDTLVDTEVRCRLGGVELAAPGAAGSWLRALTGSAEFDGEPKRIAELTDRLAAWRTGAVHDGPVRACFRLRSPDQGAPDEDDWRVEFLLQAADDPSVLVAADRVWCGDADGVLRRWVDDPQVLLLTELGRACRIHPGLDAALREAHPVGLTVDVDGAYDFLTRATALDQAGFSVLLPSWWRGPAQLGLRLKTETQTTGGPTGVVAKDSALGLNQLVDYRWELSVGGVRLTEAELAELAAAKVPLVRVRGQWVQVDQRRLAAGLAYLASAGSGQMTAGEVLLHAGVPDGDGEVPLPVLDVTGDGWLGDLLAGQSERHLEPVTPPPGFTATLRPYQRRGLSWLSFLDRLGLGACLADDMGLGKTVQLLALESLARTGDPDRAPTLLICPMSLVGNWQREAARFAPELSVLVHHGGDRRTGDELRAAVTEHDLVITTYALAARDVESLAQVRWDRVVLDEAQNIKNSAARQSRAVRALPARHRVALTGTPVENRLAELWSIMDFANPGVLGSVGTFRARFAVPVERHGDTETAARLRRITGPFLLRRVKTDPTIIDDLPDKIEMKQLCNLTAEQASLYQAVVDDMLGRIDDSEGMERRGLVLSTMTKLKQVCNHPAQFLGDGSRIAGRSGKLARLEETLEEVLAQGEKALCFTQFAGFGGMLVPHLAARFDAEVLFLHGGTPKPARDAMVRRFQEDGSEPAIFLLSLKAGGTGLTLTAANHVIHLDRWWNPAVEDQATDRAFRIGQRRDVQVRKFVCIGTLEEKIDAMIEEKKALAQLVVGTGEGWLTELSTSRLRELLTLAPEAVSE